MDRRRQEEPVSTEFRDDRFTAAFERKRDDAPVFTVAYVVRAVAPGKYVRPQASVEDMYNPSRFARSSSAECRGHGGEMSDAVMRSRPVRPWRRRTVLAAAAIAAGLSLAAGAWWVGALGPARLGTDIEFSVRVVDREGRLLRAYADRRRPLAVAGDGGRRRSALLRSLVRLRGSGASVGITASIRWPCFVHAPRSWLKAATSAPAASTLHHAGGAACWSGAIGRDLGGKLRQMVRAVEIERVLSKDEILSRYLDARTLRRQYRRRPRRFARLFRQGAATGCRSVKQRCWWPCRDLPKARRPDRFAETARGCARSRARPLCRQRAGAPAEDIALAKSEPVPSGRTPPMPMLAPHAADRAVAEFTAPGSSHRLTIDAVVQKKF